MTKKEIAVVMMLKDSMSIKDIAKALHMCVGRVEQLKNKAMKKIQKYIEHDPDNTGWLSNYLC